MVSTKQKPKTTALAGSTPQPAPENQVKNVLQERLRKARILLRKVDFILKDEGIEAAIKALMHIRLEIPLNAIVRTWLRDYRDMLDVWYAELMPEVVDEFNAYGFRRARDIAHRSIAAIKQNRLIPYYLVCERVFEQMGERKRLSVRDVEEQQPEKYPKVFSLDEVDEEEINRGTQY
jgi:hypothetical protein